MAKGNLGNLLQHFVALRVAERMVKEWSQPSKAIELIDCFAMAPWEELEPQNVSTPQRSRFVQRVGQMSSATDDLVASTYHNAWRNKYGKAIPPNITERSYPNTALLLKTAFPDQAWFMRLHEVVDEKHTELVKWARSVGPAFVRIARDWSQSSLVFRNPAPADRPVLVILDPNKIVDDGHEKANDDCYLPERLLRFLISKDALDLEASHVAPVIALLFSYSEDKPDMSHAVVTRVFASSQWAIERVCSGPWPDVGRKKTHQAWIVSSGVSNPILGESVQEVCDRWGIGAAN